jgi:hypothetical protein
MFKIVALNLISLKPILTAIFFLIVEITTAQCTSTGSKSGSTFFNNTSTGTVLWSNPSNAQTSDGVMTSAGVSIGLLSSAKTNYLMATGFNFSIPTSMTSICGITVEVEKSYNLLVGILSSMKDYSVKIVKGGVISGTDKATVSGWPVSNSYTTYGGSSDLWGLSWTPSDINDASFGVAVSAQVFSGVSALNINALIDHIRITVFYNVSLPVTFKDFTATPSGNKVKLEWSTETESNSRYFIPEKRNALQNWIALDTLPAAQNSNSEKFYESFDKSPDSSNVYRIREVDFDGRATYSKTVYVHFDKSKNIIATVYPNPARDFVNVNTDKPISAVSLYDNTGRKILAMKSTISSNRLQIPLDKLKTGVYYLLIETTDNRLSKKLVIQND